MPGNTLPNYMYQFLQKLYYKYFDINRREYSGLLKFFSKQKRILDVGCGKGDFAILDPKRIIGIDRNIQSVRWATKRGCRVIKGNVLNMPFKNKSFDGIFCAHIVEHFTTSSALRLLKEITRLLDKGGIFLIQTPLMHAGFYNNFTHEKVYTPEAIMHYLSQTPQTTYAHIGTYKVLYLKYRYAELFTPLIEPVRLPPSLKRTLFISLKVISLVFYYFGIKNYFSKNGYTLVLRKLS